MGSACTNINKKDIFEPKQITSSEKMNSKSDLISQNSEKADNYIQNKQH
jgi:hypothetical protein